MADRVADTEAFWELIEAARAETAETGDTGDGEAVAAWASELLAARPVGEILAASQALWGLLAESYRSPLWAAAYLINGGCSDDGFDYFRGWLITQGRAVFQRAVSSPDTLADLPVVRAVAEEREELACESTLAIAWNAHRAATGEELPAGSFTVRYPALDPDWGFDYDDGEEMARRLPRLSALYAA
ncbi:DUF4240 domain-containing protein [Kitasatospora sp. MMS16-BH015]|uniref:DUF4240 domain-containing protein n=1 Tax=Kitasatospora sp. MMS16-BH015 TaxID=2018025 RepID=UPI0020C258D7|nr:DUF4240 domain-containing protein [Kitasatospora sp. MMS16-BH015]